MFNKLLLGVIALLFLAIIAGTAIALCTKNAVPGKGLRKIDPAPQKVLASTTGKAAFTLIGQLRLPTKPDAKGRSYHIVVEPWLEYAAEDAALYEELDTKLRAIRSSISAYFMNYTEQELASKGERRIKDELLVSINNTLVLGKITAIYFDAYQFLD